MKFLHLADLHIGKIINGFSMLHDQEFTLGQVLRIAKEQQADAIVIAGDIYDKSAPSAEAVALFDWFLGEISEAGLICLAVPGNHDSSERIAYAQSILQRNGIYFPPVYNGSVMKVQLEDGNGPVNFWLLPFLKPAFVRGYFPDAEIGTDYTAAIEAALSTCEIDPSERNILVAHQFVTAAGVNTQRAESELTLGDVDNVSFHAFDAFDYVALGHVHHPQQVGRPEVRYCGSPLKYSFSEIRYPKTVAVVDVQAKEGGEPGRCIDFDLIPLPCLHDMREIKGTFAQLTSAEIANQPGNDDYLHIVLTDDSPVIDAIARIRAFYPNVMALDYQPTEKSSVTQPLETIDIDAIDPLDAFKTFFQAQLGHEMSEDQLRIASETLEKAMGVNAGTIDPTSQEGGLR